ncbi:MAG: CocE/NonD family hydrolase [Lachnospiraceae bacterium]|nr:CocE/NonD family hydrolase [Lachnospiraceae bacterium]
MTQWNFYLSGILYGKIQEEKPAGQNAEPTLLVKHLDARTGEWSEFLPFTPETDQFFRSLCSRSVLEFFQKHAEYETLMSQEPMSFATDDGDSYTRRRRESYFQRNRKFPKDLFYENGQIYAVLMPGRDYAAVLVKKGCESQTVLRQWQTVYPEQKSEEEDFQPGPVFPVSFHGTFLVPTRDQEQLATDVWLPGTDTVRSFPAVLVRTPYGKGRGVEAYYRFVQRGYAVVIQDTRGREDSTGEWLPEYYEVEDGDDTLNWIAAQDWSDGQVSMTGGSYLGYVQWCAAASGNPHLKAMLSSVCAGSAFIDIPRRGGCFNSGMLTWAFAMSEKRMRPDLMIQDNWDEILDIRPLKTIPEKALGHEVSFLSKWLEHKDMDAFWKRSNWKDRYQGNPVPALILSGWFDDNGMGTTEALELVKSWPKGTWKAVLGPWKHSGNADYDLHGFHVGADALRYDMDILCMMWLEHFLKGVENGIEQTPAVEYYTLGESRWKTAGSWPVEHAKRTTLYLDGDEDSQIETESVPGKKKTCQAAGSGKVCGKGRLSTCSPKNTGADTYIYCPENPSTHIIDLSENELEVPEDYTEEEKRPDILSYETPAVTDSFTVTGDILAELYISCDCPDTDFMVRITDVDESGRSFKLADGVIGAKYRNGFEHPEYLEKDRVYKISIRTTKLSHAFLPGHKMRFTVTSSAKNFIFPNSNTRVGFDSETTQSAAVTVYRSKEYPSCFHVMKEECRR